MPMSQFQLKTVTKEIGGMQFSTTQFPAMKALQVMVSLQKLTAGQSSNTQLAQAAQLSFANMDEESAKKMVLDLLQSTVVIVEGNNGMRQVTLNTAINIDLVFSGRLKILFDVMAHAIEVNYGDFSEGSDDPAPMLKAPNQ